MPDRNLNVGMYQTDAFPHFLNDPDAQPACHGVPTDVFFPGVGNSAWPARRICGRCPLEDPCREWAVAQTWSLHGIWGGTTLHQREKIRARRAAGTT